MIAIPLVGKGFDRAVRLIESLRDADTRYIAQIKVWTRRRSTAQNSRLWAIYRYIQSDVMTRTGEMHTVQDIHDQCKARILGMRETAIGLRPNSTTDLDVDEHGQYMEHVMRIAAEEWGVDWSLWDEASAG